MLLKLCFLNKWILLCGMALLLAGCRPAAPVQTAPTAISVSPPHPTSIPSPLPTAVPTPVPTASPTAEPVCTQRQGSLTAETLADERLRKPLPVLIYTPPCYAADTPGGYPVLILLHGQGSDETLWQTLGLIDAADEMIAAGEIPPLVMVFPREVYDLIPPDSSDYELALVEVLIPWLEENYALRPAPQGRALGGISRGAAWAVRLGLSHPGLVGVIGAHSLPPFYGDDQMLVQWASGFAGQDFPQIQIDTGEKDRYRSAAEEFHAALVQAGIPVEFILSPGGHDADYWHANIRAWLSWYGEMLGE